MNTLKLIQDVLMVTAIIAGLVVAFWIFPRLFLAQYSPAIWGSIRRHPILHVIWGAVACGIVYWLFSSLPEKCN